MARSFFSLSPYNICYYALDLYVVFVDGEKSQPRSAGIGKMGYSYIRQIKPLARL